MNRLENLTRIFEKHLPPPSIPYILNLFQKVPFNFKISASRKSKLGDFRYRRDREIQTITINGDLNPYQFLLTLVHEIAHLHAFKLFGMNVSPHGTEWKKTFVELLSPILNEKIFPIDLLIPLRKHMRNPKASSAGDLFLMKEMSKYDSLATQTESIFLSDLKPGNKFILAGREFEKGETRRTRVLCLEVKSGRKFLIAQLAKIQLPE
jgi:hypothetical protein